MVYVCTRCCAFRCSSCEVTFWANIFLFWNLKQFFFWRFCLLQVVMYSCTETTVLFHMTWIFNSAITTKMAACCSSTVYDSSTVPLSAHLCVCVGEPASQMRSGQKSSFESIVCVSGFCFSYACTTYVSSVLKSKCTVYFVICARPVVCWKCVQDWDYLISSELMARLINHAQYPNYFHSWLSGFCNKWSVQCTHTGKHVKSKNPMHFAEL